MQTLVAVPVPLVEKIDFDSKFVNVGGGLQVALRSAIVCRDIDNPLHGYDPVECWFEGNLYGSENLKSFYDRLACAGDRMRTRYPTLARAYFPRDALIYVARFDVIRCVITKVFDVDLLEEWADEPIASIAGVRLKKDDDWSTMARIVNEQGTPLHTRGDRFLFRLRSGQVVHINGRSSYELFEFDDPRLVELVIDLEPAIKERVLGKK